MRVVLQVVSGSDAGRKVWLETNQRLRVGSNRMGRLCRNGRSGTGRSALLREVRSGLLSPA